MDILFNDITAITMEKSDPVLYNAFIGVTNGKICYIGKTRPKESIVREICGKNKVIMPSLINCHTHSPMSLLRGYSNDVKLKQWLFDDIFPAERKIDYDMAYIGAQLSIAEMIASGTTSMSDMYLGLPRIAEAVSEAGIKANLSNGILHFGDERCDFKTSKEYIETIEVVKEYHLKNHPLVKADASIHGEYTSSPDVWRQVIDFAKEYNLRMHIHLSESKDEHEDCKKRHGGLTPTQVFNKYELFDLPVMAAHGIYIEDCDIEILKNKNATIVHNPISNLKLASGIAPIHKTAASGVNIALGTDGMASNNSNDLFEEIKISCLLQKAICDDPTVIPAYQAIEMATVNGAIAQGRENECGKIKQGFDADIIMIDFDNERLTPSYDPISTIAYSSTGQDVCLTMCKGKILYENREFKTVDVEKVLFEARKIQDKLKRAT
ncbi:MAG: amidohydrolase [Defluviitaleaceae bacterium]|nr:amidohydrolase [Defluviitaleaceae bacterium]